MCLDNIEVLERISKYCYQFAICNGGKINACMSGNMIEQPLNMLIRAIDYRSQGQADFLPCDSNRNAYYRNGWHVANSLNDLLAYSWYNGSNSVIIQLEVNDNHLLAQGHQYGAACSIYSHKKIVGVVFAKTLLDTDGKRPQAFDPDAINWLHDKTELLNWIDNNKLKATGVCPYCKATVDQVKYNQSGYSWGTVTLDNHGGFDYDQDDSEFDGDIDYECRECGKKLTYDQVCAILGVEDL